MAKKTQITEEEVLKALGALEGTAEETVEKGNIPEQMRSTKTATAGGALAPNASEDASHFETGAEDGTQPLAKAAEESSDDEESNDDDDTTSKSLRDAMLEDDNVRKGVEISPFLESLAEVISGSHDRVAKSVGELSEMQNDFNGRLQKAVVQMGNLVVEMAKKMDVLANAPAGTRKSVLSKSDIVERQLGGREQGTQFSKAQVLDKMFDLVQKGALPPVAISVYETSDFIAPEFQGIVSDALSK